MLAYYVERHLRQAWVPLLFHDATPPIARDPVLKAECSEEARRKASRGQTPSGVLVHSFRSLMHELALRTRNTVRIADAAGTFHQVTKATEIQHQALEAIASYPIAL